MSRGRGRSTAIGVQVASKWARELDGGEEREGGSGSLYCIPVASF